MNIFFLSINVFDLKQLSKSQNYVVNNASYIHKHTEVHTQNRRVDKIGIDVYKYNG